ncbi:EF-hand domain-containing family member C2 isoform X1 [Silurus meridionalis]|uniref:EF-hand domain-containing family member C2 n=1 Tax=Silurus meridionalis TaxID=175797 RepID=A0A8T0BRH2_SILME|nr:EF-hand domain-containing family member C2 isoform X1 [Silurus meridionalis]KAF7709475.1 hypothetical protein HF521_016325 [Silurus meridionalis]
MALPGYSRYKTVGKERFHKSQHFDYFKDEPMMVGAKKPGIGGELLFGQTPRLKYTKGEGSDVPSWIEFDKQVLCFDAYFQESVTSSREETYRIRQCKIYFYLEDNTIQIVEPEFRNSGITQGTLIHRQRIPLPAPADDQFYNLYHFNINQKMVFFSRTFTITDCDSFTCNFLRKMGVRLNAPVITPPDQYTTMRKGVEDSMNPLRPFERQDTLKQFLQHDRNVLRFYCNWDDTQSMFGDQRQLILHYFLADDTIEIVEVVNANSGRDTAPKFLHRSKLPKHAPSPKRLPGEITDRTVLNVFGPMGHGGRYILDSLKTGAVNEEFYKDCDLNVGGVINVWGRRVVICDCDNFTKEYYRSKYGVVDLTPVKYTAPPPAKVNVQVPPYNGFGSEEDSLSSCRGLILKRPKKDFRKLMKKDRQGLVSHELRFVGKMIIDNRINKDRTFIISFFLSDDTIAVFEPIQKNSGVIGGKYLERCRVKKPGQELLKSEMSEYYKAQDLYVGAKLIINSQPFQLVDADEYVFNYMEQHAEEFPKANIGTILSKLKSIPEEKKKEIKQFLSLTDSGNTGFIPYESFRSLLADMDGQLSEHEIIVLARIYSVKEQPELDMGLMLAVTHDHLKKKQFESFLDMLRVFTHEDRDRSGHLSTKEARIICKSFRLPLDDELLKALLQKFENESGKIDYHAFLSAINWKENASIPLPPDAAMKFDLDPKGEAVVPAVKTINYTLLLDEAFSNVQTNNIS